MGFTVFCINTNASTGGETCLATQTTCSIDTKFPRFACLATTTTVTAIVLEVSTDPTAVRTGQTLTVSTCTLFPAFADAPTSTAVTVVGLEVDTLATTD